MATDLLEFAATKSDTLGEVEEEHYHRRQAGWYLLEMHLDNTNHAQPWPMICLWVRMTPPDVPPTWRYKCYQCESQWATSALTGVTCPTCHDNRRLAIIGRVPPLETL